MSDQDLSDDEGQYIEEQLGIMDEQIAEIDENEEMSDPEKEREIRRIELVKTQILEQTKQQADRDNGIVHERGLDFFGD